MYSPKIDNNQIRRLYRLRESLKANGEKVTMAGMVRDAVEKYLDETETRKNQLDDNPRLVYNRGVK